MSDETNEECPKTHYGEREGPVPSKTPPIIPPVGCNTPGALWFNCKEQSGLVEVI